MKSPQTPSIGRVVIFVPAYGSAEGSNGATLVPAMIVRTWEDTAYENSECNLKVCCDGLHDTWRTSVPYSEEMDEAGNFKPNTWHWPPRV